MRRFGLRSVRVTQNLDSLRPIENDVDFLFRNIPGVRKVLHDRVTRIAVGNLNRMPFLMLLAANSEHCPPGGSAFGRFAKRMGRTVQGDDALLRSSRLIDHIEDHGFVFNVAVADIEKDHIVIRCPVVFLENRQFGIGIGDISGLHYSLQKEYRLQKNHPIH